MTLRWRSRSGERSSGRGAVVCQHLPNWGLFHGRTYSGTSDVELNLALVRTHQDGELVAHTRKNAQPVVLGQSRKEVLDRIALVLHAHGLLQLGDDLLLVADAECWGVENAIKSCILLEGVVEILERFGGAV